METFNIKQGDRLPILRATLYRDDGTVYDLTNATSVKFFMAAYPGVTQKINGVACDIISATGGIVEYPWAAGDTSDAGEFRAEFEINWSSGKLETVPNDDYVLVEIARQVG